MDNFWSNNYMINVFFRWKWKIGIITVFGVLIIGASTYLIKPKYRSTAVLYPVNLAQLSNESNTEQMIQILQSRDIRDSLIINFNLSKHYKIDSAYKHFKNVMYYELGKNIKVTRTEFDAVEILILDKDPQIAADMVNSMIYWYNEKVNAMHQYKFNEAACVYLDQIKHMETTRDSIKKRLTFLGSEYGIINIESQSRELSAYLYNAKTSGRKYKDAQKQMENLKKYGGEFLDLTHKLDGLIENMMLVEADYQEYAAESRKHISFHHTLTKAFVADDKYSPKRFIITLLGGISVFILTLLIIGIIENKRFNNKG